MISDLRKESHCELYFLHEETTQLHSSATKINDHMSVCLDSLKGNIPSAVVAHEVAQLRNDVSVITEGRKALPNEMDLRFSRLAEQLGTLEQKNSTGTAHASGPKKRRLPSKKSGYPLNTDSALLKKSPTTDSKKGLRRSRRATHHRLHLATNLGRGKRLRYSRLKELHPTNALYSEALSHRTYQLKEVSQHRSSRGKDKVPDYIEQMALKLSIHQFSWEDPITVVDIQTRFVREANTQEMSEAQCLVT